MRSTGGLRWGVTWGLENAKSLTINELTYITGGLAKNIKMKNEESGRLKTLNGKARLK